MVSDQQPLGDSQDLLGVNENDEVTASTMPKEVPQKGHKSYTVEIKVAAIASFDQCGGNVLQAS